MSAVTAGSLSEGDDNVKADDGFDEAAIIIAAPARAVKTPRGTRDECIFSSMVPRKPIKRLCG